MIHNNEPLEAAFRLSQKVPPAGSIRPFRWAGRTPLRSPWRGLGLALAAFVLPAAGSAQQSGETTDVIDVVANVLVTTEIANCAEADSFLAIDEAFEAAKKLDHARQVLGGADVVQAAVRAHQAQEEREARAEVFRAALEQRTAAGLMALDVVGEAAAQDPRRREASGVVSGFHQARSWCERHSAQPYLARGRL